MRGWGHRCAALLTLGALLSAAQAQDLDLPPPPPPPPAAVEESPAAPARPLFHRWMRRMAEEHPEQFESLMEARERSPEEFRRRLRQRRDQLRAHHALADMTEWPRFQEFVHSLTPEEREQLRERLRAAVAHGPRGVGPGPSSPARTPWEAEAELLARRYRQAAEEDRPAIKEELRNHLERAFDAAESARREQIAEIEHRLARLKTVLAQREEHRDQIIERRLLELTDGDPLAW